MQALQIRQKYLDFFVAEGHKLIPVAPLIPENDRTTLFTSSGMQQLVPYLKGEPHPMGKRLVDSQPSLRLQDIEEVGDTSHTTFFEMLGNWSLGDYFKKEQLAWFLEFLTSPKYLSLSKEKLYVSVFEGTKGVPKDEESFNLWQDLGIPKDRIFFYGPDKNWWSRSGAPQDMPVGEIGGPDSEVFYDFGEELGLHEKSPYKKEKCHLNCQCGRFLEIGNSVFMQYEKKEDGSLKELPQKNVDFGGGLERLTAATNNNPDIFRTDLFSSIIQIIELISNKSYQNQENQKAMRIIADHTKAATFLIAGEVIPSNVEQGYILRRLIRRAIDQANIIDYTNFFRPLLSEVIKIYEDVYPELKQKEKMIYEVFEDEESKYSQAIKRARKILIKIAETIKISGEKAFDLYTTHGLSPQQLRDQGYDFDQEEFDKAFRRHQELSRTASAGMFKGGLADHSEQVTRLHTATHLLHASLRKILGDHVRQKGSNITAERLRFDFSQPRKVTEDELRKVEALVNRKITENLPVTMKIISPQEAKESGALAFFAEKYGDKVKVYKIGDFSYEVCGGPHVNFTGVLGSFKIIKEEAAGAELRRIYATLNPN